jgi:replicative DNA helicase
MASWEHMLLSRIIREGKIQEVLQWGIGYEDFLTSEGRAMFQHLLGYFQMPDTSGAVLGPYALQAQYPTFHLVDDHSMTTDALCVEVRRNRIRSELNELLISTADLMTADTQQAVNRLHTGVNYLQNLGTAKRTDVFASEAFGRIMQNYSLKEQGVDMSICSWPWEPLQEATGGLERDDYVVLYGRPKSMKSWVLAALVAHAFEMGKKILIYTKEMTADNIFMRIGAVMAQIRYHEFRRARLTLEEKYSIQTVWRMVHMLQATQPMVCLSGKDAGDGGDTVPWLRSKIELHKPDIVFVDGLYLMSDMRGSAKQKDHARVQNISRDVRRVILDTGVPIICTLQANRQAAKNEEANLDEIAFSDAIGQDATLAMRVINEKAQPTIAMLVGGSREFELDGFRIYGIPAINFNYYGPLSTAEALRAAANDTRDSDSSTNGSTKKQKQQAQKKDPSPQEVKDAALEQWSNKRQKFS